jgi:hypothetical protein
LESSQVYGRFGKDVFIEVAGSLPERMKTENPKNIRLAGRRVGQL